MSTSAEVRFWRKVNKTDGCWLWTAFRHPITGYGGFSYQGRQQGAHRVSWQLTYGPIPKGMFVLHRCDNKLCVRPEHLFLGTQAANMTDMASKGRSTKGRYLKLSVEKVTEIRTRYAQGETQIALGREFGVSHNHIGRLVEGRGKGWRPPAPRRPPKRAPCERCGGPKTAGRGRKTCASCRS